MRNDTLLLTILATLAAASGCTQTECGEGTIERDGVCEPSDVALEPRCGPFTKLQGEQCVVEYEPTRCDPATTTPSIDPDSGIVTCIGTGTDKCSEPITCSAPSGAMQLTICGQLYDVETGENFTAAGATGQRCDPTNPTSSGPCALQIFPFDALVFAGDQTTGLLTSSDVYVDDCGRYRVTEIATNGTGPYIGLGVAEAGMSPRQPLGNLTVTATTAVVTPKASNGVIDELEAFIVQPSTIATWQNSGGPQLADGIYVGLFKAHKPGNGDPSAPQAEVTFTRSGETKPDQDLYFAAAQTTLSTVDTASTNTGANGAGLLIGTTMNDGSVYSGVGGLGPHCKWEEHVAANLADMVFIQQFFKQDIPLDPEPCAD